MQYNTRKLPFFDLKFWWTNGRSVFVMEIATEQSVLWQNILYQKPRVLCDGQNCSCDGQNYKIFFESSIKTKYAKLRRKTSFPKIQKNCDGLFKLWLKDPSQFKLSLICQGPITIRKRFQNLCLVVTGPYHNQIGSIWPDILSVQLEHVVNFISPLSSCMFFRRTPRISIYFGISNPNVLHFLFPPFVRAKNIQTTRHYQIWFHGRER